MANLRQLGESIRANGKVNTEELEKLRQEVYAKGTVGLAEADFLVELSKRVHPNPSFRHFFYQAIKDHITGNGGITKEKVAWLRQMVFHNERIEDEERKFLHELHGELKQSIPEFDAFYHECM